MGRRDKLFALMEHNGLKAAWIVKPENIRYLSGFTGEGALFIADGECVILTDFRYIEQAERQSPDCPVERLGNGIRQPDLLKRLVDARGLSCLAFEADATTVLDFDTAKEKLAGIELLPLQCLPEALRKVKDASEIQKIEQAAVIACKAFDELLGVIKPGMTEREVQLALDYTMMRLGSEAAAFETIACAGPNGSLPHAVPSDRPIQKGELLTLDFGAQVDGYKCDMTRTLAIGKISKELRDVYDTVLLAQTESFKAIRPGAVGKDVDKAARDLIDAKYPGAFGHSLGHGVGLLVHEEPSFRMASEDVMVPGHVVTVEPGIYIPGLGGCRIEDMAIITESGYTNPITADRALITI